MSLQLDSPTKFIRQCEEVLKVALNYRNLGFRHFDKSGNCVIYELNSDVISKAEAKYPYNVLPFLQSETGLYYWIALTIEFQFVAGQYNFRKVSMIIFEGMAANNMKQPLLRAEWDDYDKPNSSHAQPHWHVYPSFINKNIAPLFDLEPQLVEFDSESDEKRDGVIAIPEWEEGTKFHFAMASRWHQEGKDAHIESIDEIKLLNWLKGCVCYTKEQLIYVERKA